MRKSHQIGTRVTLFPRRVSILVLISIIALLVSRKDALPYGRSGSFNPEGNSTPAEAAADSRVLGALLSAVPPAPQLDTGRSLGPIRNKQQSSAVGVPCGMIIAGGVRCGVARV